jgi:hypothetical protein
MEDPAGQNAQAADPLQGDHLAAQGFDRRGLRVLGPRIRP